MSKIQWEYDLAERPFCEQLKAMGWQWIEGDCGRATGTTSRTSMPRCKCRWVIAGGRAGGTA